MKRIIALATIMIFTLTSFSSTALASNRSQILKNGDKDLLVYKLQETLLDQGYLDSDPTGYYGSVTKEAVEAFQKDNEMAVDGVAGTMTRKYLMGDEYEDTSSAGALTMDLDTVLKVEDTDLKVGILQRRLMDLGYFELDEITSYFGPVTEEAVMLFQRGNKLTQDGIAGGETLRLLFSDEAKVYKIYPGDTGSDVKRLQNRLTELGYYNSTVDGEFGSGTEDAVIAFQDRNGLDSDGIIGPNTRNLLYSPDALKAKGQSDSDEKKSSDADESDSKEESSKGDSSEISSMISFAKDQLGKKYKWAYEGPDSFDCSGFVYYVLKNNGVKTSRLNAAGFSQVSNWTKISKKGSLQPGDLIFFTAPGSSRIGHTGIWLGDNQYIHASSSKGKVVISSVGSYFNNNFVCGRRVF